MKRTLKLKLLFLTLLCAVAQGTWAQNFDVWDGHSEEKPGYYRRANYGICLQIRSAAQMAWLMNHYVNSITYWNDWLGENKFANPYRSSIEICADIDMTAGNWTPLGRFTNSEGSRKGVYYDANPWEDDVVFNGLGHTVKIKIDGATENYQGLFYGIGKRAKVTNLHLMADIHCKESRLVGGIAGENDGIIENCKVSGLVRSDYKSGLAVKGKVGGICGENNATVRYCCVTATVENNDAHVGGLVGCNDGTVKHCTFYGERKSTHSQDNKYVGDKGTESDLYDSYQESEMSVGDYWYHYFIKYPYAINVKTEGKGTLQVIASGEQNIPGWHPDGTVTLINTSGRNLHSISIKDSGGNDISSSGDINTSLSFTMPKKDVNVTAVFSSKWPVDGHAGSAEDPYLISSADDWDEFAQSVYLGNTHNGRHVKLTKDISVTKSVGSCNTADDPNYKAFCGTFDGDGHTLTVNLRNQSRFGAPFKCVEGATIKNLRTAGTIDGTGNENGKLLSGLVGISIHSATITGCRSSVTLTTDFGARGYEDAALAGFVAGTKGGGVTITGCVFDGSMTGEGNKRCAGIAGYEYGGTFTTIMNTLFAPATLTVSTTDDGYTKTISRDEENLYIDNCYYTRTLGAAQGTRAVALASAPDNLGDLVKDYGMVKAYQNGLFFDGKYYVNADLGLSDNTDNGSAIGELNGATVDVTLTGCTFYKDGAWNTVCLPFNLTLAGSPLDGAVARPLTGASVSGSTLNLTFGDAVTELKAGTPYIIKWASGDNVVNPKFNGVTIDATDRSFDNGAQGDARVRFIGVYRSIAFDGEDKSVLLLGGGNALYQPISGAGVGALRAYFKIGDSATKATVSVDDLVLTVK